MPIEDAVTSAGAAGASKQPDREDVQQWEDEGGAPKAPAKLAEDSAGVNDEVSGEPRGRSVVKKSKFARKSRTRTGR